MWMLQQRALSLFETRLSSKRLRQSSPRPTSCPHSLFSSCAARVTAGLELRVIAANEVSGGRILNPALDAHHAVPVIVCRPHRLCPVDDLLGEGVVHPEKPELWNHVLNG